MTPGNFIPSVPSRRLKQVNHTDGTPSREVEDVDDWNVDDCQEMKQFKNGFKKTSILDVRDELNNLHELVDVISMALMAEGIHAQPIKVYGALQLQVLPKIKQLEQELARL